MAPRRRLRRLAGERLRVGGAHDERVAEHRLHVVVEAHAPEDCSAAAAGCPEAARRTGTSRPAPEGPRTGRPRRRCRSRPRRARPSAGRRARSPGRCRSRRSRSRRSGWRTAPERRLRRRIGRRSLVARGPHSVEEQVELAAPVVGHRRRARPRPSCCRAPHISVRMSSTSKSGAGPRPPGALDHTPHGLAQLAPAGSARSIASGVAAKSIALRGARPRHHRSARAAAREGLPRVARPPRTCARTARRNRRAYADQLADQRVLRREVAVDGADADAGPARDVVHLRVLAVLRERLARGVEDPLAGCGARRRAVGRRRASPEGS